ncbi:MAG: ATP-binding cassette domain-containing protein [Sphingobacteriales bacterium]|nr:ATP-binding cassette domain-containing protein [Sphingobacteriales bacterium]
MKNPLAVRVENVSKKYSIEQLNSDTLKDNLHQRWGSWWSRDDDPATHHEDFWALRNISFELEQGDILGIVGKNGAGKSTLLKIISRITAPTEGAVRIRGKVASLLEVGTGFHPELTGRENIYLNGTILGMRRSDIKAVEEAIIDFSEIRQHIDSPIKHYSSGMRARLGFAVATHLNPDVVIIDEVLSVGDADFQRKSMTKMRDIAKSGKTVFFVSHNLNSVQSLCNKGLYLQRGEMMFFGDIEETLNQYRDLPPPTVGEGKEALSNAAMWDFDNAPGNELVKLKSVVVHAADKQPEEPIAMSDDIIIEIEFWKLVEEGRFDVGIQLIEINKDIIVLGSNTNMCLNLDNIETKKSLIKTKCRIPKFLLNTGFYAINIIISNVYTSTLIEEFYTIVKFFYNEVKFYNHYRLPTRGRGVLRPLLEWQLIN